MLSKVCKKCGVEKPHTDFYSRGGKKKHLLASYCKPCYCDEDFLRKSRERNKKYRDGTLYKRDKENPHKYLWRIARKRAEKYNIDFTISPEDIIMPDVCPILGTEMYVGAKKLENSMSLDRVNNLKGYVKGNVVCISRKANIMKSNLTLEDLKILENYIKRYSE